MGRPVKAAVHRLFETETFSREPAAGSLAEPTVETPARHVPRRPTASRNVVIMCCKIAINAEAVIPSISTPFTASSGPSSLRSRLITMSP